MRAWMVLALAACSPDIANDAYNCGANELCPSGLVCNPATSTCEASAQPFDCSAINEAATDGNTPDTGVAVDGLVCGGSLHSVMNCLTDSDAVDWYAFDAPAACTGLTLRAQVTSTRAFAAVYLSYDEDGAAGTATDADCGDTDEDAPNRTRCLVAPLTLGAHIAVGVARKAGDGTDCDGDCAFNTYTLGLQLTSQ